MKAVRVRKIEWDTRDLTDEQKGNLPEYKGFMTKDDFDTTARTPEILMKRYGCNVLSIVYDEFCVANDIEDLLKIGGREMKGKEVFKTDGKLSAYGKRCRSGLESLISQRLELEFEKTPEQDMPMILNEVMLGFEAVTGKEWEKKSCKELMKCIDQKLKDNSYVNLKDEDEVEEEE